MPIESIISSPEALTFLKGVGSKILANYLSKRFLTSSPSFKKLVMEAKKAAEVDFQSEFPDVAIFSDEQFESALDKVSTSLASSENEELVGLIQKMAEHFYENDLIYHANKDTKSIYAQSYCQKFCLHLYASLLKSTEYASLLTAKEAISESQFRSTVTEKMDVIERDIKKLVEQSNSQANNRAVTFSGIVQLEVELSPDEDEEIAALFSKIDSLVKEGGTQEEQIKVSGQLLTQIPSANANLYAKAVNTLLGCYLRGDSASWRKGLEEANTYSANLNTYSQVIIAGFYNNLQQWHDSLRVLSNIKKSDLLTFSERQKNSYNLILGTTHLNLGNVDEARRFVDLCTDKSEEDFIYVSFMLGSKTNTLELLPRAMDVLSSQDSKIRIIQAAVYYIVERFTFLQKEYGNSLDALAELKPYLELAFTQTRRVIEENRNSESLVIHDLIVILPSLARLLFRGKEILDLLDIGIERKYNDYYFLHNCAACFLDNNLIERALECHSNMKIEDMVTHAGIDLYVFLLHKAGKENLFPKVLDEIKSLKLSEAKKFPSILSVSSQIGGDQFDNDSEEAYQKFPDMGWAIMGKAEALIQKKMYDQGIKLLEAASDKKEVKLLADVKMAKLYGSVLKNYEKAVVYYELVAKPEAPIQEKIEYVYCLYNLKRFNEVIRRVDEFDSNANDPDMQAAKAYSCSEQGMLADAKRILARVCELEPKNYTFHFNHAVLCRDLGLMNELSKSLQKVVEIRPDDYRAHLMLSQCYFDQGKLKDAVTHARFALLGDFSNEMMHLNFINIHRLASQALPSDKFICSDELQNLHRDVLSNFVSRFPDSKMMTPVQFPTDEDGKLDLSMLKEMIESQNSRRNNLLSLYNEKSLPVGFLKAGLKLDTYEVWCAFSINDQQIGLVVNRQSPKHLQNQTAQIQESQSLLLDGMTLLTLQSAGILNGLKKFGKKLFVTSDTNMELMQIRHRLQSSQDGYLTIGVENGQMVREEISSDKIKKAQAFIENIATFANENCETVSVPKTFQPSERDKPLFDILDDEYKGLWSLANETGRADIWADGNLVSYAETQGKKACSIQALVFSLLNSQSISREEYSVSIGEMVLASYRGLVFTPLDCCIFISKNMDSRGQFYLQKICSGPYFNDNHSRAGFCAKLILQLLIRKLQPDWLIPTLKESLLNENFDDQSKLIFGITLYDVGMSVNVEASEIDSFLESLNLETSDQKIITPIVCKAFIEQAVLQIKQDELNSVKRKLGLPDE